MKPDRIQITAPVENRSCGVRNGHTYILKRSVKGSRQNVKSRFDSSVQGISKCVADIFDTE